MDSYVLKQVSHQSGALIFLYTEATAKDSFNNRTLSIVQGSLCLN